jgi:hypothetical protein
MLEGSLKIHSSVLQDRRQKGENSFAKNHFDPPGGFVKAALGTAKRKYN